MKKIFIILAIATLTLVSCSKNDDDSSQEDPSKKELFRLTDKYVRLLDTLYDSFGINGNHTEKTNDGMYQVSGVGRLVIIKIMRYAPTSEYEKLEHELDRRYKDDRRVYDVFLNNGGTITVDCRK